MELLDLISYVENWQLWKSKGFFNSVTVCEARVIAVMLQFSPGQGTSVCECSSEGGWEKGRVGRRPTGGLLSALMCVRAPLAADRWRSSAADSEASEAPLRGLNVLSELR